jgi:hypothetical protein
MRGLLFLIVLAFGFILAQGCKAPNSSDRPWGASPPEDNRPGYEASDDAAPPATMDSRQ